MPRGLKQAHSPPKRRTHGSCSLTHRAGRPRPVRREPSRLRRWLEGRGRRPRHPRADRTPQLHDLYVVNLIDGKSEKLLENPGFAGFGIDDHIKVQLAVRTTPAGGTELMKPAKKGRKAEKAEDAKPAPFAGWQSFMKVAPADALSTGLIGFDKSGRHAFMWDSRDRNTRALRRIDMRTGKGRTIAENPKADGSAVFIHPITRKVLAVAFTYARQHWGANDPRVKKAESDSIARAMKERGIPVSYIIFADEGHGFRREPNRLAFWAATEAFLSAHLGGKYQPVEPGEIQGTTMNVVDGVYGIPGFPALVESMGK